MTATATKHKYPLYNGQHDMAIKVALGEVPQKELMQALGIPNETELTRQMASIYRQALVKLHESHTQLQGRETRLQAAVSELQDRETRLQALVSELQGREIKSKDRESELQALVSKLQDRESELQGIVSELKDRESELQALVSVLQEHETRSKARVNELASFRNELQFHITELQAEVEQLKVELGQEKVHTYDLKAERDGLQAKWDTMYGQISPLRGLASAWAVFVLSIFVMVFDIHALYDLYQPKLGGLTASSLAVGIGFSILVFTAAKNRMGRRFAITVTFIIAGLYFEVFQAVSKTYETLASSGMASLTKEMLSPIVGTIVPPAVNAVLTSMLEDGKLEHGTWDWGKAKAWVQSIFKFK